MDELARIADHLWQARWVLSVEPPAPARAAWRARLELRRGWVLLEATGASAAAAETGILECLRRLDAERPMRGRGTAARAGDATAA